MGLFDHLLLTAVHLSLLALDLILVLMVITIIHQRWRIRWLDKVCDAIEPVTRMVLNAAQRTVQRLTGTSPSDSMLQLIVLATTCTARWLIVNLVILCV